MKRILLVTLIIFIGATPAAAQTTTRLPAPTPTTAAQTKLEQEFKQLLQERADGKRRSDKEFVERTTAETRVSVNEKGDLRRRTRAEVLADLSKPPAPNSIPAEVKLTWLIEDVSVQTYGDVAVVHYRRDARMVLNQELVLKGVRCTEVFHRAAGVWQSVAFQETVIPGYIVAAKIDLKIYDDYVGRYQLFAGNFYAVKRDGDKLILNSRLSGDQELMPENENTFVVKGNQYRVIFVRDATGQITHLRWREFPGVEYNAIKIK